MALQLPANIFTPSDSGITISVYNIIMYVGFEHPIADKFHEKPSVLKCAVRGHVAQHLYRLHIR